MTDFRTQGTRWGITKDYSRYAMFAVHPVDDTSDTSMRRFWFFDLRDAEEFIKLIEKSRHWRTNETIGRHTLTPQATAERA